MSSSARWRLAVLSAIIAPLGVALASACGLVNEEPPLPTPTPAAFNLLANPGFEDGAEPWLSVAGQPIALAEEAHHGQHSVEVAVPATGDEARPAAAVQALGPQAFPDFVSGFYYVAAWPGENAPALAFAVRVTGGGFPDGAPVHELRFMLGGNEASATPVAGVAYLFVRRGDPSRGDWTYFGYPVRQAFESAFGSAPVGWERLEVAVQLLPVVDGGEARVLFDDVYAGPQLGNPNRPE